MAGQFVTLEGVDGSGKSTVLSHLGQALAAQGYPVVLTREPGGTDIGRAIRAVLLDVESTGMSPLCEAMLYAADRAQHVAEVIRPALEAGNLVLCDRFTDSTLAYQSFGRGLERAWVEQLCEVAADGLVPDKTLLLDLPVEEGFRRLAHRRATQDEGRREARLDEETIAFHRRVYAGYRALAEASPDRFVIVNASRPVEEVVRACLEVLAPLLASVGAAS
ncbi:dTMP kinase [Nitrospinae bacterium AH_259_B05_G02_I21]|nr:dTMP kinase [Nitrospinae bacterium AH_259_B05_G02_I21]